MSVTPSGEQTVAGSPTSERLKSMTTAPSGKLRFVQAAFVQIKWKELDYSQKKRTPYTGSFFYTYFLVIHGIVCFDILYSSRLVITMFNK